MGAENFVLSFAIPEKFKSFRKYQRKKKLLQWHLILEWKHLT